MDTKKQEAQRSALKAKIQKILTDNEGHTDADYETCKSHYTKCEKCETETYNYKYSRQPNCNHPKKYQLAQPCNCSAGRNARRITKDIMDILKRAETTNDIIYQLQEAKIEEMQWLKDSHEIETETHEDDCKQCYWLDRRIEWIKEKYPGEIKDVSLQM